MDATRGAYVRTIIEKGCERCFLAGTRLCENEADSDDRHMDVAILQHYIFPSI